MRIDINEAAITVDTRPVHGLLSARKKYVACDLAMGRATKHPRPGGGLDSATIVVAIFDQLDRPEPRGEQVKHVRPNIDQNAATGHVRVKSRAIQRPIPDRLADFKPPCAAD